MKSVFDKKEVPKFTLLIVEDHKALRKFLIELLGMTFADCLILEARSGEEAISVAHDQVPDIVLMDIGLPKMDGIEATRRIKADFPGVNVIIVSIHDGAIYRTKAEAAGAARYVAKKDLVFKLIPTVEELLSYPPLKN